MALNMVVWTILGGCPATADTNATTISWVCNYPDSKDGYGYSNWTMDMWELNNYDYYSLLSSTLQAGAYTRPLFSST
jgi:hypothetical protein